MITPASARHPAQSPAAASAPPPAKSNPLVAVGIGAGLLGIGLVAWALSMGGKKESENTAGGGSSSATPPYVAPDAGQKSKKDQERDAKSELERLLVNNDFPEARVKHLREFIEKNAGLAAADEAKKRLAELIDEPAPPKPDPANSDVPPTPTTPTTPGKLLPEHIHLTGKAPTPTDLQINWDTVGAPKGEAILERLDVRAEPLKAELKSYLGKGTAPKVGLSGTAEAFAAGTHVTQDGDETFTRIPAALSNMTRLRTSKGDKAPAPSDTAYVVGVDGACQIYLPLDPKAYPEGKLPWMDETWVDSGLRCDSNGTPGWTIWEKTVAAASDLKLGAGNGTCRGLTFVFVPASGWKEVARGVAATGTAEEKGLKPGQVYCYRVQVTQAEASPVRSPWLALRLNGTAEVTTPTTPATPNAPAKAAPGKAVFAQRDDRTKGAWIGIYGRDGYYLPGFKATNNGRVELDAGTLISLPSYVTKLSSESKEPYIWVWALKATEAAALQLPGGGETRHSAAVSWHGLEYLLEIASGETRQLSIYLSVPEKDTNRAMHIEILDAATDKLIEKRDLEDGVLQTGVWLSWNVTGGVKLKLQQGPKNNSAVLCGIFFDPVGSTKVAWPLFSEPYRKARDAWRKLDLAALKDLAAGLKEEAAPLKSLLQAGIEYQTAVQTQLKALEDKDVFFALRLGGTRAGHLSKVDGVNFTWQGSGTAQKQSLADLAPETWRELADAGFKETVKDATKAGELRAAAALLGGDGQAIQAALGPAGKTGLEWGPFAGLLAVFEGEERADALLEDLDTLGKAGRWGEAQGRADAFSQTLVTLPADMKAKLDTQTLKARTEFKALWTRTDKFPLAGARQVLPTGQLELTYDFHDPRQLADFELSSLPTVWLEKNEVALHTPVLRHCLPLRGDLKFSYEATPTVAKFNGIGLRFYEYAGSLGADTNTVAKMFRDAGDDQTALAQKADFKLALNQWQRVEIAFDAAKKNTKVTVDGKPALEFNDTKAIGAGYALLTCGQSSRFRNIKITGTPDPLEYETFLRQRAYPLEFQKRFTGNQFINIFNRADEDMWVVHWPGAWTWNTQKEELSGEGVLALPGIVLANYEAKFEARLEKGNELRFYARVGKDLGYSVVFRPSNVLGEVLDMNTRAEKKTAGVVSSTTKGGVWGKIQVIARGNTLKIVLNDKETLVDLGNLAQNTVGFFFYASGRGQVRNFQIKP